MGWYNNGAENVKKWYNTVQTKATNVPLSSKVKKEKQNNMDV